MLSAIVASIPLMSTIIKATSTRKDMCDLTLEMHLVDKAHLSLQQLQRLIHPSFQPQYSTYLICEVRLGNHWLFLDKDISLVVCHRDIIQLMCPIILYIQIINNHLINTVQ